MKKTQQDDLRKAPRRAPELEVSADLLPPHSVEGELGVLGCIMLSPVECMSECEERGVAPDWFYDLPNRTLFVALDGLNRKGTALDLVTVAQALKDSGELEQVGGLAFLAQLPNHTPSSMNLRYYLDILAEKFQLRSLLRICIQGKNRALQFDGDLDGLVSEVQNEVLKLSEEKSAGSERPIKECVLSVIGDWEDFHRGKPQMVGMTTGLEYLDKLLLGIGGEHGNLIIIGGRPGTGKTSLALQIAMHAALDYVWFEPVLGADGKLQETEEGKIRTRAQKGVPVAIFSMEMAWKPLVDRMIFQRGGADMQRWRTGFAVAEDFTKLTRGAGELMRYENMWIDDTSRQTIEAIAAKARRLVRQHGVKLFVLDYLQLMRASGRRFVGDRVGELTEISGMLQALGKELNVPFVVLAQMNRDSDKEPNRQPRLSDLKDCGAIEQDADLVLLLYKAILKGEAEEKYNDAMKRVYGTGPHGDLDWSKVPKRINALIGKYRYGPSDMIAQFLFHGSCTRYEDWNVWLKRNDLKAPAAGEGSGYSGARAEDMPSDEELGLR